jgi:tetratricopeptide (TPR) repeat protein
VTTTTSEIARAQALISVDRADEAAAVLSHALASEPANAHAWCLLASAHLLAKRPQDALEAASRSIALEPEVEWSHRLASVASLRLKHRRAAVREAREAVRLAPHLALAHAQLSLALAHVGAHRWRESATEADEAIRLGPNDPSVHYTVGLSALKRGRRREAERHNLRVLELDPTHANALTNLSVARLRRGRVFSAADGFAAAAALDPTNDLHRRNIEAAVARFFTRGSWIVAAVAALSIAVPGAALCTFLLPALAVVAVVSARRILSPTTWRYARRAPFRNGRVTYPACVVIGSSLALLAVPFLGRSTADSIAGGAFFWTAVIALGSRS